MIRDGSSQKHVSVEVITAKLFWNAFKCIVFRMKLRNAAPQWQSLSGESYSQYWDTSPNETYSLTSWKSLMIYDKRKAVLIRGLEMPFSNAEKRAIWYAFESETHFCRGDIRQSCFETPLNALYFGWNCPMQLRSDKAFLANRTRNTERSMVDTCPNETYSLTSWKSLFQKNS